MTPTFVNFERTVTRTARECTRRIIHTSPFSRLQVADSSHPPPLSPVSFEELGLHPPIVTALRRAFPNIVHPTEAQARFIPEVLGSKDVLLRDFTGSGKSFGLLVALLNKARVRAKKSKDGETRVSHCITSLVVVPHRDLAYQYLHWIERIVACAAAEQLPELKVVAQILVRDGGAHLTTGLASLQETSPHILIGTPQALIDVWHKDQNALQLSRLSTVVVDEVDYLVETLARKDPKRSFGPGVTRAAKKLLTHPGVTRELLDVIYAKRKEISERRKDEPGLVQHQRRIGVTEERRSTSDRFPQLVMCSATLRGHLRSYLFQESGWLNTDNLVVLKGATKSPSTIETEGKSKNINVIGGSGVTHSILVVNDDGIINVKGAVAGVSGEDTGFDDDAITAGAIFGTATVPEEPDLGQNLTDRYAKTGLPFNPNVLEAIATAFALDVPSIALLVLPASAPVQRAIYELREMGVNADGLDLLKEEKGKKYLAHDGSRFQENPMLLVSTLASTRGIDLPELSHVFILGIPEGPRVSGRGVDAYLHVGGRVGRFGRGGKVITIVETASEGEKMKRMLKTIEVKAERFEQFE